MKNTFKRILALVLVIACVVPFVACAKPKLNVEKAKENLEAADYLVYVNDDLDMPYIEEMLTASKGTGDERTEITIVKFADAKSAKLYYQGLKLEIEQDIESAKLELKTYKRIITKYGDDLDSDEVDDLKDEIKELEEKIEELKEDLKEIGRSGKYVWVGDKEAVKATK